MQQEEGTAQYLIRTVGPICVAALIAIIMGLVAMSFIGGLVSFTITFIVVICGFILGFRRGEDVVQWIYRTFK